MTLNFLVAIHDELDLAKVWHKFLDKIRLQATKVAISNVYGKVDIYGASFSKQTHATLCDFRFCCEKNREIRKNQNKS